MAYPWLAGAPALNRDYDPTDLGPARHLLSGAVVVEAGRADDQWLAEVEWVESLAADWPFIVGMVAHAPLENRGRRAEQLAELGRHSLVVGVRRNIQDEGRGFALGRDFVAGVESLAEYGFPFDLCVRHWQLVEVTELVRRLPEVTFVLDHCGKPAVAQRLLEPWRSDIARMAELSNVVCKLSGLTTEADHRTWRTGDIEPYVRHALDVFGPDRCLFGGDWPVATLATPYERWRDLVARCGDSLSDMGVAAIAAGTAVRVYRLAERRTVVDDL